MVGKYAIVAAGRNVSIHTADMIEDGFETIEDAVAYIDANDVMRAQIVALIGNRRRWLDGYEQARFNRALSGSHEPLFTGQGARLDEEGKILRRASSGRAKVHRGLDACENGEPARDASRPSGCTKATTPIPAEGLDPGRRARVRATTD